MDLKKHMDNVQNPPRPELSDLDLVRRSQMEDLHAYEQLVRRYHERIHSFTYGMTGNREAAEEINQIVFSKAWKAIGHFREQMEFSIWMDRIALYSTLNFCKKRKRRIPSRFEDFDPRIKQSESYKKFSTKGSVLRKMSLKEFQQKMNDALLALPTAQRATLILHDMKGRSSLEVAAVMSGTEGPARSRLAHARKKMKGLFVALESDLTGLLALKAYERPNEDRVEKNIENVMRAVRTAHKKPSLHHFPDKSIGWMFAQPRYGVAALFLIFLGIHLLDRPLPDVPIGTSVVKDPSCEVMSVVETNSHSPSGIPAVDLGLPSLIKPAPFIESNP